MNRTKKGSIIVEAIVMLGLIATMTPILYKHVAERRQDIENINEANTLLLLKNATAEYIEANKESITSRVLSPTDIGIDIFGYQIGIKKDSSGNIDAMITGVGGNDMKAAKVASLLGISAGIYSAQNTAKAWGINGVWAEDISNYGFSSLPTGIPVVTTAYDKEDTSSGFNEDVLKEFIETTGFNKLSADEFCLKGKCIAEWADSTYEPIPTIINCNSGDPKACKKGFQKGINTSCKAIAETYQANEASAQTGFYTLTSSESTFLYNQPCVFQHGELANAAETIVECNLATLNSEILTNVACRYGYVKGYNTSCTILTKYYPAGAAQINTITTSGGGNREACPKPCAFFGTISGGECKDVNGWGWVRSTNYMNYWNAQTFCSNLGMELKSMAQIQAIGLWNPGSRKLFVGNWAWSTDVWNANTGWLVWLGKSYNRKQDRSQSTYVYSTNAGVYVDYLYALCGPK